MCAPSLSGVSRGAVVIAALAGLCIRPCQGQASDCTYDLCALRLHSGSVVQGLEGKRIAKLGMFSSRIAVFEQAPDSVRGHYNSFRSAKRTGTLLEVVALAAMTTGLVLIADQGKSNDASQVFFFAGLGFSIGGGFAFRGAANHLSQAVWWYNRGLVRSP